MSRIELSAVPVSLQRDATFQTRFMDAIMGAIVIRVKVRASAYPYLGHPDGGSMNFPPSC